MAVAFGAFGLHLGGDVPWVGLPAMILAALAISVLPGWVVGSSLGPGVRSTLLGTVAYALLAWTLWIPIAVVGSTWVYVVDGSLDGPVEIVASMGFMLAYAAGASLVLWMLALPFAIVWMIAYRSLRRLV